MILVLLKCVGQAVVENAAQALIGSIPFGDKLFKIAARTLELWKQKKEAQGRRAELEMAAQMAVDKVKAQAKQVAKMVTQNPAEQEALAGYLEKVPGQIRRSLARPQDMRGRTVPAGLPLDQPKDLLNFLPLRPPRFRPGQKVQGCGSWQLEEWVGVGGFAEVWKARSLLGNRQEVRALKFCLNLEPAAMAGLKNEIRLLKALGPQNGIVALQGASLDADPPFVVYDYIPGGDLTRLINCWQKRDRDWVVAETVRLLWTLAKNLRPVHHSGIVHRDLKPSNILLKPDGKKNRLDGTQVELVLVRIADFGIGGLAAKQALEQATRMSAFEASTYAVRGAHSDIYAPFEQKAGQDPAPTDDVYALGIIGYQFLTGNVLTGPPPDWKDELKDRKIPPPVVDVLRKCMADNPADRPANAAALFSLLQPVLDKFQVPTGGK